MKRLLKAYRRLVVDIRIQQQIEAQQALRMKARMSARYQGVR